MDGIIRKTRNRKPTYQNKQELNYSRKSTSDYNDLFVDAPLEPLPRSITTQKKKKGIFKKIFIFAFSLLLIGGIFSGAYFFWKIGSVSSKISSASDDSHQGSTLSTISNIIKNDRVSLKGEDRGRINVLLLGVAGKGRAGGNLTDTIMIASIDMVNKKTALLSLPRDFYVEIADSDYRSKINSIYKYGLANDEGIEPLKKTIENITDLNIDYYFVASFAGFEKFINDIDGIVINNERDIYDPSYPGPNYNYELFALEKGTHLLDGETALKYARERHDDPEGDFGRAKRQQQVMQAIKSRVFSTKVLFNPFAINNMLNTLGESITTDISLEEMESFLELSKELDTQNITNVVVDAWKKDSLLKVSHIYYDNIRAFILVTRVGNYSEIQDLAKNIFNLDEIKRRKEEMEKENANIAIVNKSGDSSLAKKIKSLLEDNLEFKNVSILENSSEKKIKSSQIEDFTDGRVPFTLDELIKKLPARLSENVIISESSLDENLKDYDLIVIIGSDLIEPYSYEESSMEEMEKNQNSSDNNKEILIKKDK